MRKKVLAILLSAVMVFSFIIPAFAETPYSDVPDYHWAVNAVNMLTSLGIIQGYPDGTYKGQDSATRYELALMVARLLDYMEQQVSEKLTEVETRIGNDILSNPPVVSVAGIDENALEQSIVDKISAMNEEQWNEFDKKLTYLFNDVKDIYARLETLEGSSAAAQQSELAALSLEFAKMKAAVEELQNRPTVSSSDIARLENMITNLALVKADDEEVNREIAALRESLMSNGVEYIADPTLKNDIMILSNQLRALESKVNENSNLKKDVVALSDKVKSLEAKMNIAPEVITNVEQIIDPSIAGDVSALNAKLNEFSNRIYKNSDSLTQLNAKVAGIVASIDALKSEFGEDLKALGLRIDNLENELNKSKATTVELSAAIRNIEGKVNANEKAIADLNKKVAANETEIAGVKRTVSQNYNDILDLMDAHTNNVVKPLTARVADHEDRLRDLEYDQTNLGVKVDQIQKNLAYAKNKINGDIADLDSEVVTIKERLDGSIVDKFNITGDFTTALDHVGIIKRADDSATEEVYYSDPFTGDKKLSKKADVKSTLNLNGVITPEAGVSVGFKLKMVSDLYRFQGNRNLDTVGLDGAMSLNIKTDTYLASVYSGALSTAPNFFTTYVANNKNFTDKKYAGLKIDVDFGKVGISGMFAKAPEDKANNDRFKYLYAFGGTFVPVKNLTIGARGLFYSDIPEAGDTTESVYDRAMSANYNLKINDNTSSSGEIALFKTPEIPFKTAAKISATTKIFDALVLDAGFSRIEDGYTPAFVSNKEVKQDTQKANIGISIPEIADVITIKGKAELDGDVAWDSKKTRTLGVEAVFNKTFNENNVVEASAGVDFIKDIIPEDDAYNVYTVKGELINEAIGLGLDASEKYSTKDSSHTIAANAEIALIKDVLSINGGYATKIVGDEKAKQDGYVKYNVGGDLTVSLIDDVLKAGVSGSYYNKNYKNINTISSSDDLKTAYKGYDVGAELKWTIIPGSTLTGNVGMEKRTYQLPVNNARRSGFYRYAGINLSQQLFKSTTLNAGYTVKDYSFDAIDTVKLNDYWTRTVSLSVKVTF